MNVAPVTGLPRSPATASGGPFPKSTSPMETKPRMLSGGMGIGFPGRCGGNRALRDASRSETSSWVDAGWSFGDDQETLGTVSRGSGSVACAGATASTLLSAACDDRLGQSGASDSTQSPSRQNMVGAFRSDCECPAFRLAFRSRIPFEINGLYSPHSLSLRQAPAEEAKIRTGQRTAGGKLLKRNGAGDGVRTRDVQLGNLRVD
jgi:hypothetical protein